ncbi:MAG: hypothetical protein ACI89X_002264 [Planctomycetota bacterium]|jgi:hypothetical protein
MRTLVVLLAATLFSGCSSTVLAEPAIHVSPYLALYQLRGKTKMQSVGAMPSEIVSNPQQKLRSFGQDRHREDVGLRADIGDGFGGIRAEYYRLDMDTARTGELEYDWGSLLQGDMVSIYAEMDEVRIGYLEPFADIRTEYRNEELRLQFAAGGVFSTRSMTLHGREATPGTRAQDLTITGDVVYLAARARATWKQFVFDLDYAGAPEELVISGDMEDFSQDIEARLSYRLPQRDISFFAGMRYSTISASGDANGFRYDNEMAIDGFQLGITVTF